MYPLKELHQSISVIQISQVSNLYYKYEWISKNYIKNIRYELNEQQYFEMETEMDTDARRVVKPWMQDTPTSEGDRFFNIG